MGIKTLELKCSRHITDAGVSAVAESLHLLEWVELHHCPYITDECITALVNSCVYLDYLDVRKCALMTISSYEEAHAKFYAGGEGEEKEGDCVENGEGVV